MKTAKKLAILSYGCQMNMADSERMAGKLAQLGCAPTDNAKEADIILINTCCVRETAEEKIYGKIGELKAYKQQSPNLIIGVMGCMAQKEGERLVKRAPHIDFVLGTNKISELTAAIEAAERGRRRFIDTDLEGNPDFDDLPRRESKVTAWVPIMQGCNNFCTYCIVPYVRGREKSRPPQNIIEEIKTVGKSGYGEVVLLGQNVNSYGKEFADTDFADLLTAIDETDAVARIRFMTSHPKDLSDKLIEAMKNGRHICRHIHLPIQHAADRILQKMNRNYTKEHYRRLVQKIRAAMPDAAVTTDIIVGFPGETDADFAELLDFTREIRFDSAYTFLYSKRSGTPAATMPEQVPEETKKARLQKLMDLQNEIGLAKNEQFVGRTLPVLVEGASKNNASVWTGRADDNRSVLFAHGQEQIGDIVNVKITKAQTWLLKGVALDRNEMKTE